MSAGKTIKQKKAEYIERLVSYLETYPKILVVSCDNIGSAHMQKIRKSLRGRALILMGKNTLVRRAIRLNAHRNEKWNAILPLIVGNVGLVFTKEDNLSDICAAVQKLRVPAAAKPGVFAPKDVFVPKGMTGLEPTKTSFLQALNINTKINRGSIEILNDIHLIKKGDRVGSSEAALLQMLDVKPFEYGLVAENVYDDGSVYGPYILSLKESDILAKFSAGVANVASLSLGLGIATLPALPHVILGGYQNLAAIALEIGYDFEQVQKLKEYLMTPRAVAPTTTTTTDTTAVTTTTTAIDTSSSSSSGKNDGEDDLSFDLFGDSNSSSTSAPSNSSTSSGGKNDGEDELVFDIFG